MGSVLCANFRLYVERSRSESDASHRRTTAIPIGKCTGEVMAKGGRSSPAACVCLPCVCHVHVMNHRQYEPNSENRLTTAPRLVCAARPMFANKAGIARRIERRDRQRKSQHLDEPAYLAGPPNVGRSPCAARFASLEMLHDSAAGG